ncbi:hypothetical protein NDU88_003061 [Pleurodeles waltl]|uniref:Uncharacterized protein n=1 Tax=Pleurodeles waltl TaxID=8319 RepID=A0AAV7RFS1_PLEWA|nr:hypothetical protein NDU88_003061 [Pleurodeles waltl]
MSNMRESNPAPGRGWGKPYCTPAHRREKAKGLRSVEQKVRLLTPDAQTGKCRSDASETVEPLGKGARVRQGIERH